MFSDDQQLLFDSYHDLIITTDMFFILVTKKETLHLSQSVLEALSYTRVEDMSVNL